MANRPKPPTISDEELAKVEAAMEGLETELLFGALLDKINHLREEGRISAFAYYAEILTFIAHASFNDPQWVHEFSAITQGRAKVERTVTIPVALLGALAEGWVKYREAEDNLSLGRACGVEAGGKASGQGKRTDRDNFSKYEFDEWLALRVIGRRSWAAQRGEPLSLSDAYAAVATDLKDMPAVKGGARRRPAGRVRAAEESEGAASISVDRIEAAYNAHGRAVLERLRATGAAMAPLNVEKSSGV